MVPESIFLVAINCKLGSQIISASASSASDTGHANVIAPVPGRSNKEMNGAANLANNMQHHSCLDTGCRCGPECVDCQPLTFDL